MPKRGQEAKLKVRVSYTRTSDSGERLKRVMCLLLGSNPNGMIPETRDRREKPSANRAKSKG